MEDGGGEGGSRGGGGGGGGKNQKKTHRKAVFFQANSARFIVPTRSQFSGEVVKEPAFQLNYT